MMTIYFWQDDRSILDSLRKIDTYLMYYSMGLYDRALPLYESALEIHRSELVDRPLSRALSLNNLALLYSSMGKYDRALPLYESALETRKSELGARHPDVSQSLNNLAQLYKSMGQYDRALPLYESALEISQSKLGNQHPDTVMIMNNLAGLYRLMGNGSEAEAILKPAMSICEDLGANYPIVFVILKNLINLHLSNSEYYMAGDLLMRWLKICYGSLPLDHIEIQEIQEVLAILIKSGLYSSNSTLQKPTNPKAFGAKLKKRKK
jgi:tetratricopeptide (TPR) repeat protein